jgi:hypothetical protein
MRVLTLLAVVSVSWSCSTEPPAVVGPCGADETPCGSTCARLKVDDLNCGSCGRACEAGKACANAACHPTSCNGMSCDPSSVCFENECTDKSCVGVVCPSGTTCSQGACVCGGGRLDCAGRCVEVSSDDANCGACGASCGAAESCARGACLPDDCPGTACDALSVCYQGACTERSCVGVTCEGGKQCSQGTCVCPTGRLTCSGACVDPLTDEAACGGCGRACGAAETCAQGACLPDECPNQVCDPLSVCYQGTCVEVACVGVACPGGQVCRGGSCGCAPGDTTCNGQCTDAKTDEANCGMCGFACTATQTCAAGGCFESDCPGVACDPLSACYQGTCTEVACIGVSCPGGQVCSQGACQCPPSTALCGGQCVNLAGDLGHCGRCDRACAATETCSGGQCLLDTCTGSGTLCGSTCVNTQTDVNNCGACGAACGGGRNCVAGQCACPAGLTFCGTQCVNLATDGANCGGCGRSCGAGTCSSGVCNCPLGQTLCNGACVSLSTSDTDCGQCGRACTAPQVCSGGLCSCPPGQALCGGQCISTSSDNLNCGGCGTVCPNGRYCSNSVCVTPFTCQVNFNAPPMDCGAFPLSLLACGVPTVVGTAGPFTGTLPTTGTFVDNLVDVLPQQRVRVTGTFTGSGSGANYRFALLNDAGVELMAQTGTAPSTSAAFEVLDLSGGLGGCNHPFTTRLTKTIGGTLTYSMTLERMVTSGRYNAGGPTVFSPTALATNAAGRTCEQVCGALAPGCSARQAFSAVIPPGKAADVQLTARAGAVSGAAFYVYAYDSAGLVICELIRNQFVDAQFQSFTGRLVNNTAQAQTVILQPSLNAGVGLENPFHLSVAVEP